MIEPKYKYGDVVKFRAKVLRTKAGTRKRYVRQIVDRQLWYANGPACRNPDRAYLYKMKHAYADLDCLGLPIASEWAYESQIKELLYDSDDFDPPL